MLLTRKVLIAEGSKAITPFKNYLIEVSSTVVPAASLASTIFPTSQKVSQAEIMSW